MTPPRKMTVTLSVTVHFVDGPIRDMDDVADAAATALAGETLELTTHEAFPRRSRYLVDDAEVLEVDR